MRVGENSLTVTKSRALDSLDFVLINILQVTSYKGQIMWGIRKDYSLASYAYISFPNIYGALTT